MSESDPYHDHKKYHMAKLFSQDGDVSPLCADKPRKLNLKRELWTITPTAVTCRKCKSRLPKD